jgi:hypothetical protein
MNKSNEDDEEITEDGKKEYFSYFKEKLFFIFI